MRAALLGSLRQQMDGCSRDQFWAVASISGLNGLLVSQLSELEARVPVWTLAFGVIFAGLYATYYTVHRHRSYYRYSADVAALLADEESAPDWMKTHRSPGDPATWLGTAFYVSWILGATTLGTIAILAVV